MASSFLHSLLLLSFLLSPTRATTTLALKPHLPNITSLCNTTPYPNTCFNSLKLTISITIPQNILSFLLHTLQTALSEAHKLSVLLSSGPATTLAESRKGAIQDCVDLHAITTTILERSVSLVGSSDGKKVRDARAFLSAALTNKDTCSEGLEFVSGSRKGEVLESLASTYEHVSNSLSLLSKCKQSASGMVKDEKTDVKRPRKVMRFLDRVSRKYHRTSDNDGGDYEQGNEIFVAKDGSGQFSTISDAINFAPNNSYDWVMVYVKAGVYDENVEIQSYKTNIVLLGDGSDVTVITGNRSVGDGWTTFRSATVAVSGSGFLARDITIQNTAGPAKHQAVALRINADFAAVYRCKIIGYQDTLYAHSFRQFYRECDIYGTIDYIFGNAGAVFQACNIITITPLPGQGTVITAQSRDSPDEDTGFSLQNCSIINFFNKTSNGSRVIKSYLGRPWRAYSRTVYMESYIDGFIDPSGWAEWSPNDKGSLGTLYYGEYENVGPGSVTEGRVSWSGYHVMDYDEASNFTVSELISGYEWLDSTSFPYDDGV